MLILTILLSSTGLLEAASPSLYTRLGAINEAVPINKIREVILRHTKGHSDSENIRRLYTRRSLNNWLRQMKLPDVPSANEKTERKVDPAEAIAAEKELQYTLTQRMSALDQKPYVEKKGLNDFLVMADNMDPTAKIIPNDIYYNIEKGCVNWLDNCNLKGVKASLLNKITGPYRK